MSYSEQCWWNVLTFAERQKYERAVQAIAHLYGGDAQLIEALIASAYARGLHRSPVVAAILWRLEAEIAMIPEDYAL